MAHMSHQQTHDELQRTSRELVQARERIVDMLRGDDGQAFKEARKFIERTCPEYIAKYDL